MAPSTFATWEGVLAHITEEFECDDSSSIHARLRLPFPVMVWKGQSSLVASREAIHIASPIAPLEATEILRLARAVDEIPCGALRLMNGLVHLHETMYFPALTPQRVDAAIRLIAAEASTLRDETVGGL